MIRYSCIFVLNLKFTLVNNSNQKMTTIYTKDKINKWNTVTYIQVKYTYTNNVYLKISLMIELHLFQVYFWFLLLIFKVMGFWENYKYELRK